MSASRGGYRAVGIAFAFFGAAFFSLKGVTTKLIYAYGVDAVTLLALRMLFSVPFFLAVAAWSRREAAAPVGPRDQGLIVVLGLLSYYVASFLDFLGLQFISATLERLTLYLYPTVVLVLSVLFLKAPIRGREIAALVLSYAGIALVLVVGGRMGGANVPLGAALVFASAVTYSVYLVAGTQVIRRVGSMRFTAYGMTAASVVCVAQFLLLRPLDALVLPWSAYGWFAVLAIVHTVLPVFMTAEALKRIGATQVAIIGAVGPVTTMAADWIVLGERLAPLQSPARRWCWPGSCSSRSSPPASDRRSTIPGTTTKGGEPSCGRSSPSPCSPSPPSSPAAPALRRRAANRST